jgi:hypothetical protein
VDDTPSSNELFAAVMVQESTCVSKILFINPKYFPKICLPPASKFIKEGFNSDVKFSAFPSSPSSGASEYAIAQEFQTIFFPRAFQKFQRLFQ